MSVEYLPRFDPTPEQRADRNVYAKAVQGVICGAMGLPAVEAGYAEKTQYHTYLREQFRLHPWGGLALLLPTPDRHRAVLESRARHSGGQAGTGEGGGEPSEVVGGGGGGGREAAAAGEAQGDDVVVAVGPSAVAATPDGSSSSRHEGEAVLRRRVGQLVTT